MQYFWPSDRAGSERCGDLDYALDRQRLVNQVLRYGVMNVCNNLPIIESWQRQMGKRGILLEAVPRIYASTLVVSIGIVRDLMALYQVQILL